VTTKKRATRSATSPTRVAEKKPRKPRKPPPITPDEPLSGVERAQRYMAKVADGSILACEWVKLAVARQARDLTHEGQPDWPWHFDIDHANAVVAFMEAMPQVKGSKFAGKMLILSDWQCFIITTIFGWLDKYQKRRFRTVYIEVPRKNGKSTMTAPVGLFCLAADGELGAEVYSAATTREQAKIIWNDAQQMVTHCPDLRRYLGVGSSAHTIYKRNNNSVFKPLSRDRQGNLDGLNVHCGLIDELHGHKDRGIWDVLETATGAREQSLLWAITTAGSNRAGICYEQRNYVTKLLQQIFDDETYFGIIYTLDKEDIKKKDYFRPEIWQKANPNYGISVEPDDLARKAHKAQQTPSALANFLTKHLNVWVNADAPWMSMAAWDQCADTELSLDNFKGQDCVLVGDLATKTDMLPIVKLFKRSVTAYNSRGALETTDHYYVFADYYLPKAAIEDGRNSQYGGWAERALLTVTPGEVTDFATVEEHVKRDAGVFKITHAGFDPWQASYLMQRLEVAKLPVFEYRQTIQNMSLPMKELEGLVLQRRIHHNGDPILAWMISNVVCHTDVKENVYPRKEKPENKIDGAVALIMAVGISLAPGDAPKQYQAIFL
jgi:phage terminase large subunit-like protein